MINPSKNYDVEPHYTNPRAWGNFKKAIDGQHGISDLMRMLEKRANGYCVRLLMSKALHAYLRADESRHREILSDWSDWYNSFENHNAPEVQPKPNPPEPRTGFLKILSERLSTDTLQLLVWVIELEDMRSLIANGKLHEQTSDACAAMRKTQKEMFKQIRDIMTDVEPYAADANYQVELSRLRGDPVDGETEIGGVA